MTPNDLTTKRAVEAVRRARAAALGSGSFVDANTYGEAVALAMHQVEVVEQWTPPEPVDPDLLAVRELCAEYYEQFHDGVCKDVRSQYREGYFDDKNDPELTIALAAYHAGRKSVLDNRPSDEELAREAAAAYLGKPPSEGVLSDLFLWIRAVRAILSRLNGEG